MTDHNNPERISLRHLWNKFLDGFDLEKGLIHTFRELCLRPGTATRNYLIEDRKKLINPFKYFILAVSLKVLFGFLYSIVAPVSMKVLLGESEQQFEAYASFLVYFIVFTLTAYIFFRKPKYNFFELLVVSLFWVSHSHILFNSFLESTTLALYGLTGNSAVLSREIVFFGTYILQAIYLTWAMKSFVQTSMLKAIVSQIVTLLLAIIGFFLSSRLFYNLTHNTETTIGIETDFLKEEVAMFKKREIGYHELTLIADSVFVNGPAWKAGIVKGDTILMINGMETYDLHFNEVIDDHMPGDTISVTIHRDSKILNFQVILTHSDSLKTQTATRNP